jgi:hypothetical protein
MSRGCQRRTTFSRFGRSRRGARDRAGRVFAGKGSFPAMTGELIQIGAAEDHRRWSVPLAGPLALRRLRQTDTPSDCGSTPHRRPPRQHRRPGQPPQPLNDDELAALQVVLTRCRLTTYEACPDQHSDLGPRLRKRGLVCSANGAVRTLPGVGQDTHGFTAPIGHEPVASGHDLVVTGTRSCRRTVLAGQAGRDYRGLPKTTVACCR